MNRAGDLTIVQATHRLYRVSGGTVTPLLRPGDAVPGAPGMSFSGVHPEIVTNGAGVTGALALLPQGSAVITASPAGIGVLAREDTPAPGFSPNMVYSYLDHP